MRCNLNCAGCYSRSYSAKDELNFSELDGILEEAKGMGIYFITISGGEPFIRKDLLDLYEKHNDLFFHVYSNGSLIDRGMAERLERPGNVAVMISLEGWEEETDARRGKGVFIKVMEAMDNLRQAGVLFGFSLTAHRHNFESISSPEFIDMLMGKGCYMGWYFMYIPVGKDPDIGFMLTPEQRNEMRNRVNFLRNTRPIFIGDFWNDGPYADGCIAGGQKYLHINAKGEVEPCVFIHFATDNIRNKSLKEALNSPFFQAIRKRRALKKNPLSTCIIIDYPEILMEACEEANAYPTDTSAPMLFNELKGKIGSYSKRLNEIYDEVWQQEYKTSYED